MSNKANCEFGALNNVAQRNVAPNMVCMQRESRLEYTNHPNEPTTLLAFLEVEQTAAANLKVLCLVRQLVPCAADFPLELTKKCRITPN